MDAEVQPVKDTIRGIERRKRDLTDAANEIELMARNALTLSDLKGRIENLVARLRDRAQLLHQTGEDLIEAERVETAKAKKAKKERA